MSEPRVVRGSCLCGRIRYEIDAPLGTALHCHCSMCRARAETVVAQHMPARRTLREAEVEGRLDENWTSQLIVVSDAEFAAGVARIRAAARTAEARGEELVLESDLRLFATTAWRA